MALDWIMVRLTRDVHSRLLWVRQLMEEMAERGVPGLPEMNEQSTDIPLTRIVEFLLDHYMDYRGRSRKPQGAGRKARQRKDVDPICEEGSKPSVE